MLLTVTNNLATAQTVGFPINRTLAAGASVQLGVSIRDLEHGEDVGDVAWRRLDALARKGDLTLVLAADANEDSILNTANRL